MKVGVIGAGVMGSGIAQVCAQAGHNVILYDLSVEMLDKANRSIESNLAKGVELGKLTEEQKEVTLANLSFVRSIEDVRANLIIEAVVERLDVKVKLFNDLCLNNGPDCILATNTSSIPITQLAAATPHPERVIGIHFFNPAHIMKLVEVVRGAHTNEEVVSTCVDFVNGLGKKPVQVADAPGFIVNRVARNFYVEGLKCLEEQVAGHDEIDALMEASGFKMGPFRLMDLIGVETNYSVTESMFNLFNQDSKFRPSRIQKQKVDAGFHGRKSGQGFYKYE